jgi:inner membrane protein
MLMGLAFRSRSGFLYNYGLSFLGYASHIGLDLTNQYGTRILSPLADTAYALDLTFIIDPFLLLLFGASLVACWKFRSRAVIIACCALLVLCGYLGGRYYLQGQARQLTKNEIDANIYKVYPVPNGLFRWWFVAKTDDEVTTGVTDLFMQKVFIYKKQSLNLKHPSVEATRVNPVVSNFLNFSRQPKADVMLNKNGTLIIWHELSYAYLPGERFQVQVTIGNNGVIKDARLFY